MHLHDELINHKKKDLRFQTIKIIKIKWNGETTVWHWSYRLKDIQERE